MSAAWIDAGGVMFSGVRALSVILGFCLSCCRETAAILTVNSYGPIMFDCSVGDVNL